MRRPTLALVAVLLLAAVPATNTATAQDTPGLFCEEAKQATGRIFPEASETTDFVGLDDARCGLQLLEEENPDYIDVEQVGESEGWHNYVSGEKDSFGVPIVEVTNEESDVPFSEKPKVLFMLSIHGNEKGGREGGLRVIEDLVRDIGMAEENPELREMLDRMVALFIFPNPDGWAHEMAQYRANDACYVSATCEGGDNAGETGAETQNFVRVNGNGVDLNREAPTVGWQDEGHTAMSEPAPRDYWPALKDYENLRYASDLHGMLHPADSGVAFESGSPPVACVGAESTPLPGAGTESEVCLREGHFVLTMLPAGQQTPEEITKSTRLAEDIKSRLNSDEYFTEWNNAPEGGVWGGEYNDWGTVWDTIGYTDSGFSSDYFAQDHGLNVPGVDFEFAYNHITFDNYYPGLSQRINAYHIETTRVIVHAFMDHTDRGTQVTLETPDGDVGWVATDTKVTDETDPNPVSGWAAENPDDDHVERGKASYTASPNQFFQNLTRFVDDPSAVERIEASELPDRLDDVDRLAVPGSAVDPILDDPAAQDALRSWVESGGTLFLTDAALQLLEPLGVAEDGAVDVTESYAGHTNFVDDDHELADGVRGLARQTYEPVPLGFSIDDGGNAPIWHVERDAYRGEVVGVAGFDQGGTPVPGEVNLGKASVGDGEVAFLGAVLPDPTTEYYHPYGLDGYATTYTGKQVTYNALDLEKNVTTGESVVEDGEVTYDVPDEPQQAGAQAGEDASSSIPGPGIVGLLAALGAALIARRRL